MQVVTFARRAVALVTIVVFGYGVAVAASAAEPQPGRDYTLIVPAQPTTDASRIVVTEFFSYACPHCFAFAPALATWARKLPDDVLLERTAVAVGRPIWVLPAQLYYALRAMGKADELESEVFDAIHLERASLSNTKEVADWVAAHGVDRAAFEATLSSFSVKSFVTRADQMARAARVPSVPTLAIDGKYLVAIADNGAFEGQLGIVDSLIAKVRAERGTPQP
jgi:thiol:disulfide interchange protein DsbA